MKYKKSTSKKMNKKNSKSYAEGQQKIMRVYMVVYLS